MSDTAARLALSARRNEVARLTIVVTGIDMTGVAMAMQIRLGRDVPGVPLIALATVTTLAAEGLKLDSVTTTNGVPTSVIKGRINASTMTDATKVPYMGEVGTDSVLAYAMQWTLGGDAQTRLYGDFVVVGSAFGSDGAPANRPPSYGGSSSCSGGTSSGSLAFGDQVIAVTLASSDLVGIEVAKAIAAATQAVTAANDANVVATGTDLRSAASKVIAVGADLLLGAASKIAIVAADLVLGAGSFIARAPQAALDAIAARTGADAAAASVAATVGTATEVTVVEAAGVNLNVSYAGAADGTAGDAVGAPALVASGKAFTVTGGYAVSATDTSIALPAFLTHTPNYAAATQTTVITPAAASNAMAAINIGPLAYYQDAANFGFWAVNRDDGRVYLRRVSAGSITSAQTFVTGSGALSSWTIESRSLGSRQFSATLIRGDGTKYGPFTYTASAVVTPAWGIVAAGPSLRARSVIVSTNRSQVVRRVADTEAALTALATKTDPAFGRRVMAERDAKWPVFPTRGGVLDIKASTTEYVLIDTFADVDGTVVGAGGGHVPDHVTTNLPTGYTTWGTMPWQTLGKQLAPLAPTTQAQRDPGLLVAAVGWRLSKTWLRTMKGVELAFDLSSSIALDGEVGGFFKTENGAFLISITQGQVRLLYRNDAGGGATLASGYPPAGTFPTTTSVRCVIRAYEGNGFIAQIGTTTLAWGFASELGKAYPRITHAGLYVDPRWNTAPTRFGNLKIGPVPAQGGSRYRSIEPLPTAIGPKFTKRGVQWGIAQADTSYGVYNFWVVPMHVHGPKLGIVPIDKYYAYFSTDHAIGSASAGGIFFATGPTPLGPWTRQGPAGYAGAIFKDVDPAAQCETPVIHYDEETNRILMTYQVYKVAGTNVQETRVAWSVDGVNWTKIGPIYAFSETALVPDHFRHTGYMSWSRDPLGIVPGYVGWSRMFPAADSSLTCTTRSVDGIHWDPDPLETVFPFLQAHYNDRRVIHNHGYATIPFAYQGQRLMIVAPFRVPEQGDGKGYLALVRLGDDMRNMSAQEVIPFPMTDAEELTGSQTVSGVLVEDSMLYVWYQSRNRDIRLATADLTKGPDGLARPFGG